MKQVISLLTKFGHFIILFNLILLIILIFLKRFGLAEEFGNFLLFLSMLALALQILKTKAGQPHVDKKAFLIFCVGICYFDTTFFIFSAT